jgi:hypothetical protein
MILWFVVTISLAQRKVYHVNCLFEDVTSLRIDVSEDVHVRELTVRTE